MGGETANGSWFSVFWPVSRKTAVDNKASIGILASEVASLMLKVVNLWRSLSDLEAMSLKEELINSVGLKILVSDNDDFLMELALNEILDNFEYLARSVARLGKRCADPVFHRFELFVDNPAQYSFQWSGWEYKSKKMEKKVKKMERFAAAMTQLSQELEVLAELEQTFRRMQANPEQSRVKLLEFQKKVMWQRQEVKNLRHMSPWNRSYDYIVRLLAKSLLTILERIIHVYGNSHLSTQQQNDCPDMDASHLPRSHSFSVPVHSSFNPSYNQFHGFHSEPLGSGPVSSNTDSVTDRSKRTNTLQQALNAAPALRRKHLRSASKQLAHIGPFKGCMWVGNESPVVQSCMPTTGGSMRLNDCHMKSVDKMNIVDKLSLSCRNIIYSKLSIKGRLKPAPITLGDSALALHYANVIILIERMVSSPHLVDLETRDDLYNMLPAAVRSALRAKLKWCTKSKDSSIYDANLAEGWIQALTQILEWLAPLAHNMIKWHSERNFEKEYTTSKANVLLVQTLYFANQPKTEAAMIELLVGLNYVCRIDREIGSRDTAEFAGARSYNGVCLGKNDICNEYD
ncbi:hypothetical protein QN277_013070 [Acacia crassicarpa]|uniref:Uncharacterized protein n=1 Tax=Acacia crassicarpa TaxID=499986 RepID=A0AAE1TFD9_9FABA|nr:hypothetical protein QN277_013070 [Acacia crassicarpa]